VQSELAALTATLISTLSVPNNQVLGAYIIEIQASVISNVVVNAVAVS
jgi:hypothetical protein